MILVFAPGNRRYTIYVTASEIQKKKNYAELSTPLGVAHRPLPDPIVTSTSTCEQDIPSATVGAFGGDLGT